MPAEIQYLDPEVVVAPPPGQNEPLPIPLGPSWRPNDIRLCFSIFSNYRNSDFAPYVYYYAPSPFPPAGFTTGLDPGTTGSNGAAVGHQPKWAAWRRLVDGDVDNLTIAFSDKYWLYFSLLLVTARGVDPASTPQFFNTSTTQLQTPNQLQIGSFTLPGAGDALIVAAAANGAGTWGTNQSPQQNTVPTTGSSLGVPLTGSWKALAWSERSGADFYAYDTATNIEMVGKRYTAGASTGTVNIPAAYTSGAVVTGQVAAYSMGVYLKPAPDTVTGPGAQPSPVQVTGTGSAPVTSTNPTTGPGAQPVPVQVAGVGGGNPLFAQITGTLALPGTPVRSSLVDWDATVPAGAKLTVLTSVNNGMSWDTPTKGQPVPRLSAGNTACRQVLIRATLTRPSTAVGKPVLRKLHLRTRTDDGVFQYAPIGYGVVDEPKVKISATGAGGSGGGGGVKSTGGGQVGGGPLLKVHAVDPSRLIKLAGWQVPYIVPLGENYVTAAVKMAQNRLPWLNRFSLVSTDRKIEGSPLFYGMDQQQDPWLDIRELVNAIGYEAFFQADGALRIQPIPDPRYTEPVWTIAIGQSWITEVENAWSDEYIRNCIIVEGESTASKNPVSAFAQDDDPTSDTWIEGSLGLRTLRGKYPHIKDKVQAQLAADGLLANSLGLGNTITVTIPPVYVLEPGDVVRLVVPQVKALGNFVISSMSTPGGADAGQQLNLYRQMAHT